MPVLHRPRRLLAAALPALLALMLVASIAGAQQQYPNSVFTGNTEFNRDIGHLFRIIIWLGGIVFLFVEGILLYTIWKFRRKSENDRPEHVHGNTTLEILWTAIPAIILVFIAVPTVQTIFRTQAKATPDALQVEVIGHQWWWEFRYPQFTRTRPDGKIDTLVTANELYLPLGRKVNFSLTSQDVIHSFWIPQLGGKRDVITNRINYLWFTPDSVGAGAWNGFCAEFCGTSHGNMHFKAFTVTQADFQSWTGNQLAMAAFGMAPVPVASGASPAADSTKIRTIQDTSKGHLPGPTTLAATPTQGTNAVAAAASGTVAAQGGHDMSTMNTQQTGFVSFPREKMPAHVVPQTPLPAGLTFDENIKGDAQRGYDFMTKQMGGGCLGCHTIDGNPVMVGKTGPNLTHIATRTTIGAGLYPNDTKHLARWIKNARWMKPGVIMPTLGAGQLDRGTNAYIPKTGLNDQQIADIVAYLQALK